jgi:hypothetical protein
MEILLSHLHATISMNPSGIEIIYRNKLSKNDKGILEQINKIITYRVKISTIDSWGFTKLENFAKVTKKW